MLAFRRLLFPAALICYIGVVAAVVYGLITIQSDRDGKIAVEQVTLISPSPDNAFLQLVGSGFSASVGAMVLPEWKVVDRPFFLKNTLGRGLWFDGRFLLANDGNGLLLSMQVDADNSLRVLGSLRMPGSIRQFAKVGDRALVSLGRDGFWLVDLADPASPVLMDKVPGPSIGSKTIRDLPVAGQRVYSVARNHQVLMIDLAEVDPVLKTFDIESSPWRVALRGNRLVTGSLDGVVELFDLDENGRPHAVGRLEFDSDIRGLQLTETALFVATGNGEMHLYDTTSWPLPHKSSILSLDGQIIEVKFLPQHSQLLVSRSLRGFLSIDVSDIAHPVIGKYFSVTHFSREMSVAGELLASLSVRELSVYSVEQVLHGAGASLQSLEGYDYDIYALDDQAYLMTYGESDKPAQTKVLSSVDKVCGREKNSCVTEEKHFGLGEDTCLAIAARRKSSMAHLFCREKGQLLWQTTLDFKRPSRVLWRDERVYAAIFDRYGGKQSKGAIFRIYDASSPQTPLLNGELFLPGEIYELEWLDPHFVLVAAGSDGLYVVDVADPGQPVIASQLQLPEHLSDFSRVVHVKSLGSHAYLTHQRSGVSQVDLSDPRRPQLLRKLDVPGTARKMTIQNGLLFTSLYRDGAYVVDVGNGDGWAPVGQMDLPMSVFDLQACRGKLFVSGGEAGLLTLTLPKRLPVRPQGLNHARIALPKDLEPGKYRLYLYSETENLQVTSAFQIKDQKAYSTPTQN